MTNENFEAACAHDTDSWFDRRTMLRIGAASAAAAAVVGFGEAVPASAANWSDNLGTLKIGYLPQEPQLDPTETVRQSVENGMGEIKAAQARLEEVYAAYAEEDADFDALAAEQAAESRYLKIIRESDDGLLVGAAPDERIRVGENSLPYFNPPELADSGTRLVGAFFWAVNKVQGATRGRSDLMPVADFLDLYDRLIFDEAERMSFLRAFVYDVTITGADEAALTKRAATSAPPKPGSVYYHNEAEELKAVTPDLKAQDGATTADLILSLIATGVGLPKTWLNGIMDVNRASAASMDEPSLKRLRARQQVVIGAVERMVRFALDRLRKRGLAHLSLRIAFSDVRGILALPPSMKQ